MIKFPEDFTCEPHHLTDLGWAYRNAKQWKYVKPNGILISVVGGCAGLHGDGVNTFEMWDFDQEEPQGYLTKEQINEYLNNINIDSLIKPLENLRFMII